MATDGGLGGGPSWRRPNGIFLIIELRGDVAEQVREIQRRFDPKLASSTPPHITLVGSSGAGPIAGGTTVEELRRALEPIADDTPPMTLHFGAPTRFMQTEIVVLPLDPHGPLRTLHERIKSSGLSFQRPRFAFTPHATLSFYPTLSRQAQRELLGLRVREPMVVDHIKASLTNDPLPPRAMLELELGRGSNVEGRTSDR